MVNSSEAIAYAEICVYVPIFILTAIVVIRHGFHRQLGWIYLAIFCGVRVAGSAFKIASIHSPTNKTDLQWSAILQSVGLSPLLLASLGLLKRITDDVSDHVRSGTFDMNMQGLPIAGLVQKILTKRATANSRRSRIIQLLHIPIMIALILCVTGGLDIANVTNPSDVASGKKHTKIGVVIFLIVYLLLLALVIITMKDIGKIYQGEKRIYFVVVAALPPLAVRILWSLLAAFKNDSTFSVVGGQPIVQLFMAILEEFFIVVIYTLAGITVPRYEISSPGIA